MLEVQESAPTEKKKKERKDEFCLQTSVTNESI